MKYLNRSAITVYGTEDYLHWIKSNHLNLGRWTLENLNHHPNVYLVEFEDQNCWGNCFEIHFEEIFRNEVGEYVRDGVNWPENISYNQYKSWFTFKYAEYVVDLAINVLEISKD
jgi:hypothetical protein